MTNDLDALVQHLDSVAHVYAFCGEAADAVRELRELVAIHNEHEASRVRETMAMQKRAEAAEQRVAAAKFIRASRRLQESMRARHRVRVRKHQRSVDAWNRGYRVLDLSVAGFFLFAAYTNTGSIYGTAGLVVLGLGMLWLAVEPMPKRKVALRGEPKS